MVVVYCRIRRRRSKSGDNHQELEYTNKNNRVESEYNTIQDGDTKKHDSSYHYIDDSFLQNSTNNKNPAGSSSNNTPPNDELNYQVIDHGFTAKSTKAKTNYQDIDHDLGMNTAKSQTASPKNQTNYTGATTPNEDTSYTYIDGDFGTKAAKLPSTASSQGETNYTYIDHDFSTKSIKAVGSPPNKTSPKQESNYHVIDNDFDIKSKPTSGYCDPRIKLDPRTQPLDSKFQYSVVKPKNTRRQGTGNPSEYDHISAKTTADNLGKEEPMDPNYDQFKRTSSTSMVKDKTYYDHIPKGDEHALSDPYSDPTYNHLGEKGQISKPQQDNTRNLNPPSNSQYQPQKSKANIDDPTYNHLGDKHSITKPQTGNTVFSKSPFHGDKKDTPKSQEGNHHTENVHDLNNDPTYNHLGKIGPTSKSQQGNHSTKNVDDSNNDPTYNHLGGKVHTPQQDNHSTKNIADLHNEPTYNHLGKIGHTSKSQEGNHSTMNVDDHNYDPTYSHLGEKGHTPKQDDNTKHVDDPNNDPTYNHLGGKGYTAQQDSHSTKNVDDSNNDPTYNHLGEKGHTPKPQENIGATNSTSNSQSQTKKTVDDPYCDSNYDHLGIKGHTTKPHHQNAVLTNSTFDSQCQADDPTYNHLGDDNPESQKHQERQ
ncbi:protein PFC0760c-like [Patella vulgata]|uniref:protein PFC0760c-like n=1 Tax=Patella vulgata TaxID=6465 RepID=UPI0024A7DBE1|nr:protein PFC0760c-like [Patella vulgata]